MNTYADIQRANYRAIIVGLQGNKHLYAGTVPESVVADRRAKNRAARRARRGNVAALRKQARSNRLAHNARHTREVNPFNRPVDAEAGA